MQNELPKTYDPKLAEDKWYKTWLDSKSFEVNPNSKKQPYTILMPPPNVTGILHMGHALDITTQDTLIRFKRMQGFEALWLPGYDHAGISMQAVVEKKIYKETGKTKLDIGREEFTKELWKWKEDHGESIINQQKKLGSSCDWNYHMFTMDETPNKAVKKVFVELFNQGLIYQADYIVNWDPQLQSAISDAEVEHKEVKGNFYHILYKVKDEDIQLEVATTRPETLFGDTAIAVNPNDERFKHLIGKIAILPIMNKEIPIIGDEHVDLEKGTGCLKVTPGHDFNDFEIGKRHDLAIVNILNRNGSMNENTPDEIQGLSVKKARKKTIELLTEKGLLVKTIEHTHQVGHGERSGDIVEPMVSKQWFVNVQEMAKTAVESVENNDMTFYPKGWENTYFSWLREPRNWCISRQLWWGHQIPVFYCSDCGHTWASEDQANECEKCHSHDIHQDPDVLDTWFSSGLWPLSTLGWPDEEKMKQKRFDKFYPTQVLVTGFDIIFFWVARMMMMNINQTEKSPFSQVYIHAIVRDKLGRKMSKSLGNGIDPVEMIDQYGADALRFSLASDSGYNRHINLDPDRIEGYRNFINKIWNAFRFIHPFLEEAEDQLPEIKELDHHDRWILSELNIVIEEMTKSLEVFRFDDACSSIYSFVYDKFCSWYIELSKNILYSEDENAKKKRSSVLKFCFKEILKLMHPIAPFITEEMWSFIKSNEDGLIIHQKYPVKRDEFNFPIDVEFLNKFIEIVTGIRNLRSSVQIKPKEEVKAYFFTDNEKWARYIYENRLNLQSLAKVNIGEALSKDKPRPEKSILHALSHTEIYLPLEGIDLEEQRKKLQKQIDKNQKEFDKLQKKLSNPKFVENAPDTVIEEVKEKAKSFQETIKSLEKQSEIFK